MKRLIIILCLFVTVLGAGIAEFVYADSFFDKAITKLEYFADSLYQNKEQTDNPETIERVEQFEKYWQKHENNLMLFINHATVRSIQEKISMLVEYTRVNSNKDVCACYLQVRDVLKDVAEENSFRLFNLL